MHPFFSDMQIAAVVQAFVTVRFNYFRMLCTGLGLKATQTSDSACNMISGTGERGLAAASLIASETRLNVVP